MKLAGAQVIAADRMAVWNAINDPEILKQCIPGCDEMERTSDTQFDAVVRQKVGPVSATFKGVVNLSDVREGESLRLSGEGKGGVAGMAKGGAVVTLTDVEGGTQLAYDADASVAGKLAQLGSRLIDGVAQKMVGTFFDNFKSVVETGSGSGAGGSASSIASASQTSEAGTHGSAMATATGAVGAAGAAAAAHASGMVEDAATAGMAGVDDAARGMRDGIDAHAGALHDAAAERMLNPAIGTGSGEIDMDDPDIGDIDMSSVEGGFDAARAAGSQSADMPGVDVAGNLGDMAESFDANAVKEAAAGHVGSASEAASDAASHAVNRVGEQVAASASDATSQASAMASDAANASHSGMDAGAAAAAAAGVGAAGMAAASSSLDDARDTVAAEISGHMDAATDAVAGAQHSVQGVAASASASASGAMSSAEAMATDGVNTVEDAAQSGISIERDGDMRVAASTSGAAPNTTMPESAEEEFNSGSRFGGAAGAAAAAAGVGIAGYAASAREKFDGVHDAARERVIAAGGDVDEAKSWADTKDHLGRAGQEARDTAQDVYDAARARIDGDMDRANAEWNEAKTNASEAYGEAKGAAEDAWTTGKGYAAEQAKAPSVGPLGQPWYLWIIGIIVLLVILWML